MRARGLPWILLLIPVAASDGFAAEGPLEVQAKLVQKQAARISVGEPFQVVIEARHAPGGVALLAEELELPAQVAERRTARRHIRERKGETEIDRYELELIAFEAGVLEIPKIRVALGSTTAASQPISLEVLSAFSGDAQRVLSSTLPAALAELEKMVAQNPSPKELFVEELTPLYAALGLAGAALMIALVLYLKRRMVRVEAARPKPRPPPRPAGEVALERLEALRASDLLARENFKAFFVELSEILRGYAGDRYDFDSIELTVDELLDALRARRTPGLDLVLLRRILESADLVKFAKFIPTGDESLSALNGAFDLVERTAPAVDHADRIDRVDHGEKEGAVAP